jgi:membrane fusion protein
MSDLFRKEAVFHATRRLSGSVVLATPLSVRLLGLVFGVIVLAAVFFAAFASYARKATVSGWLVPDQGLIRSTASSPGFIQSLVVKEGDVVEKGARLAEIRVGTETANGNVGDNVMRQLSAEVEAARARARTLIEKLDAESRQASERITKLRLELEQLTVQAELQQKRLKLAQEQAARGDEVAAKGLLPLHERDARRSEAMAAEQELAVERRQISGLERDISDTMARISAIVIEEDTASAESRSAQANLQQRMLDAEARRVQVLLSPVTGLVAALPVSVGQHVSLDATIAVIIPQGAKLEGELLAPSRAVGFIRPGQEVHLMLQAFPHQRFGTLNGVITSISNTILGPTELSIPGMDVKEPVFRVRVALPREEIQAYGQTIPLQPGLLLSADVVFDRRSLIQWLFDPLFAVVKRS